MKETRRIFAAALACVLSLAAAGCSPAPSSDAPPAAPPPGGFRPGTETEVTFPETPAIPAAGDSGYDLTFSDRDAAGTWDDGAVILSLPDAAGAGTLTLGAGTFVLEGELEGSIRIEAGKQEKVQLVLHGVRIDGGEAPAIHIEEADKVFVTLAEGTENALLSASEDAALFSRADLTVNGTGRLAVEATAGHAVESKDDLIVTGGVYDITAAKGGLHGKDCVKIMGGDFTLETGSDAVQAENSEDADRGFVYIAGGNIRIDAQKDGIQAETGLILAGGTLHITAGGGRDAASAENDAKALKAGGDILAEGGEMTLLSAGDALHSDGSLAFRGGTARITAGGKALHADHALLMEGGAIVADRCEEGLEGCTVTVTGGSVDVTSDDDGINASDTDALEKTPDADLPVYIRIAGGDIRVDAGGDGLDANGDLFVQGGNIRVDGPTGDGDAAIDYDGTAAVTGGSVLALGSIGMARGFVGGVSAQPSFLASFDAAVSGGENLTITDSAGNVLLTVTAEKDFRTVVFSDPALTLGETYTLTAGDVQVTVELTEMATGGEGFPGMGPGGFPGEPPEGMEPGQFPGEPPEGMEPGQFPGEPPEGMEPGQFPGEPPEGMEPGQFPGGMEPPEPPAEPGA